MRVWLWVLANVDYETGELTCTYEHIADRVSWIDKGHPHVPSRRIIHDILHWMKTNSMLSLTTLGDGNRKYTKVSVCQWATYQSSETGDGNRYETEKSPSLKKQKEQKKKKVAYAPSAEAELCVQSWEKHNPLPAMKNPADYRRRCVMAFDSLHLEFDYPWPLIHEVCSYAIKHWLKPGYISSPYTLNRVTKKGDRLQFDAIKTQMETPHQGSTNGNSGPGTITRLIEAFRVISDDESLRVYDPNSDSGVARALPEHTH